MPNRSLTVGLFVIAGLALFTIGLFLIGNRHEAFSNHMVFYAEFKDLDGLSKGSKVQVAGMDAGRILEIGIPNSPNSGFRVKLRIDESLHGLVRTDSVATIGTQGVVGDTFVLIHPGSASAPVAPALTTLPSREPTELADLLNQSKGVLADADGAIKNANGLLTSVGGNLNKTLSGADTTLANVNDVVVGLREGRGTAGMLLRDETVATQIRQTVSNAQQATADLGHVSKQADGLMTDIRSREFPQKIDDTMAVVKNTATNLDSSAQQINQTLTEINGPDEQGLSAGVNIREALTNANVTTANMADDTEALKHNFFFRGFFHHRGYFTLSGMDPVKYRNDKLFTNRSDGRAWVSADQLFRRQADGRELLTAQGKALLNSTLARFGDSVLASPIVIEGYSSGGDAADNLALSNKRAILVRQYLLTHFRLNPGNIGAVALSNIPPAGLDHPSWDGICIVVPKGKA